MSEENVNVKEVPVTTETASNETDAAAQPVEANREKTPTIEQVAKFFGTDAEKISKFNTFIEANGKFDSAFSKLKQDVTGRNTDKKEESASQPERPEQPEQKTEEATPAEPAKPAEGYVSPQDFALKQYFKAVAQEEKYASIAKDIEKGGILKEMAELGIKPTDENGNYNDAMIHKFLDLKAATVPAAPSVVEPTTTPTVTFTELDGDIESFEDAQKVIMESMNGRAKGAGEHPKLADAKKFMSEYLNGKK